MKQQLIESAVPSAGSTLLLLTCKGVKTLDTGEIVRIEALSNYSKLYFSNGKTLVVAKVLHWFRDKLPLEYFVRVHRSHIVNVNHIKTFIRVRNIRLVLTDESIIEISRRKKNDVVKMLQLTHYA